MRDEWLIWQILDSAFPAGGFAHSGGLETAWQQGWVRSSDTLREFLVQSMRQAAPGAIPFVRGVFNGRDAAELDHYLDTMLSNHVANRASRLQGQALIGTATRVFGCETIAAVREAVLNGGQPGHLAVIFGVVIRALGMGEELGARMYGFLVVRGVLSAAVRLGVVGPLEAQRLQAGLGEVFARCISEGRGLAIEETGQCAPLIELWQLSQDRLYSRLFQS